MGTHPSMPSRIVTSGDKPTEEYPLLADRLLEQQNLLGQKVIAKYGVKKEKALPFLFKVLSINKALSIQAHPDKKLAEQLHAQKPDMYKGARCVRGGILIHR